METGHHGNPGQPAQQRVEEEFKYVRDCVTTLLHRAPERNASETLNKARHAHRKLVQFVSKLFCLFSCEKNVFFSDRHRFCGQIVSFTVPCPFLKGIPMPLHRREGNGELAMLETFFWHFEKSFTLLYHCKLTYGLTLMQRHSCLSIWHRELWMEIIHYVFCDFV